MCETWQHRVAAAVKVLQQSRVYEYKAIEYGNIVVLDSTIDLSYATYMAQNGTCVGDTGAILIGEMLKVNTTLQWLWLVRVFCDFFVAG
jgi:hypothetical protein